MITVGAEGLMRGEEIKVKVLVTVFIVMALLAAAGCSPGKELMEDPLPPEAEEEDDDTEQPEEPDYIEIIISAVGDVMTHAPQLEANYYPERDEYNFCNNYRYIAPFIREADLAIGNLETTLPGAERGFRGRPTFRTPDSIANALKYAGFDVLITANNHAYDSGRDGFFRTQQVLIEEGFGITGTRMNEEEPRFYLTDVEGIRVGIAAFTYEWASQGRKSINGHLLEKDMEPLINSFSYKTLTEDVDDMLDVVSQMQEAGAEVIIFCMHWGTEYTHKQNANQESIAGRLAEAGVDIIFGGHPHVLQPMEIIESDDSNEKQTLVFYSLGNFISNHRREYFGIPATEDGMIATVTIRKDLSEGKVALTGVDYLPTWVHKYNADGRDHYDILPVEAAVKDATAYGLDEKALQQARSSAENTHRVLRKLTGDRILPAD